MTVCAVTPFNNVYRSATPLGGGHFPLAPFYVLIWLTMVMAGIRALFRNADWLTGRELLVIWILMVVVSGIAYTGFARTFFINLTAPFHFATVGNRWEEVLHPLLPPMLYPRDPGAISLFYDGIAGGRDMNWWQVVGHIPWDAWLLPLCCWGVFILAAYFVMLCLANLLNRQAIRSERMNFPLLRVPQMLEEAFDGHAMGRFLSDPFLLAGLSIPILLHLMNGLNLYFPAVPQIPTLILAGPYFPKYGLFSGFYKLKIYIFPAFIGFAFLASKQISLSFWLFYLLGGLLFGLLSVMGYDIPPAALGVTFGPTLAHPEETQAIGAYAVFFVFLFWLARHHLLSVVKDAFRPGKQMPSETEWMSYRFSFWGVVIGSLFIVLWAHYFGLSVWVALLVTAAFFMVMLVASRVVCQGGVAYFTLIAAPLDGLLFLFGPRLFSHVGILLAGVMQKVLFVDLRESLMPSLLHAGKVTHRMNPRRRITITIMVTLAAGLVVSAVAMLALCYKYGVRELQLDWATRTTVAVYENIQTLVETPLQSGNWVTIFAVAGAVVMLGLVISYHQFYWWPIHPIGYLTTYSSAMKYLWFAFFLGWICNVLCMRYGGVVLFRRLRFFFVGMIIGDFFMGGTWAIVGLFTDTGYLALPG